ncbi:MAG: prolyl oligopeptidase family serine peptidase [Hyphomicrobiales bacterium]|nr:prolyl oligopeptidase family serine peptidase [Hyphomicrobiales bacterium]MCP5371155.1 prolyl oligopeptidase family serine peptidase [Hyphomicrobiales bacterium]
MRAIPFLILLVLGWAAAAAAGDVEHGVVVGGVERSYLVHLPPGATLQKPAPVVIVLHGGGGRARQVARATLFSDLADREGFIVVYPNGTGRGPLLLTWNARYCCGHALREGADDLAFLAALIDKVAADNLVDRDRVYLTGPSNGGMMAFQAAAVLSGRIAAIAPVIAGMFGDEPPPKGPVSVLMVNGGDDTHVPLAGGWTSNRMTRRAWDAPIGPARDTLAYWARANGCTGGPAAARDGAVETVAYAGCARGTDVVMKVIHGSGHVWPGGWRSRAGGKDAPPMDATRVIWEFFKAHPRR